jgi:hypothetical protein
MIIMLVLKSIYLINKDSLCFNYVVYMFVRSAVYPLNLVSCLYPHYAKTVSRDPLDCATARTRVLN